MRQYKRTQCRWIVAAGLALTGPMPFAAPSPAATVMTSMAVSATVEARCTIGLEAMSFNRSSSLVAATVLIACPNPAPCDVRFGVGSAYGMRAPPRPERDGTAPLRYLLSYDAIRQLVVDDGDEDISTSRFTAAPRAAGPKLVGETITATIAF